MEICHFPHICFWGEYIEKHGVSSIALLYRLEKRHSKKEKDLPRAMQVVQDEAKIHSSSLWIHILVLSWPQKILTELSPRIWLLSVFLLFFHYPLSHIQKHTRTETHSIYSFILNMTCHLYFFLVRPSHVGIPRGQVECCFLDNCGNNSHEQCAEKAERITMHMGEIQAHYNAEDSQSIMSVTCRVWSIVKPNITRANLIPREFSNTYRNKYNTKKEIKFFSFSSIFSTQVWNSIF